MVLTIFHLFQQLIVYNSKTVALIFVILSYLGDPRCPVASFKKYMDKLHPENDNFGSDPRRVSHQISQAHGSTIQQLERTCFILSWLECVWRRN